MLSASRTGSGDAYFYREESGYTVDLARLYDGQFGPAGGEPSYSVLPNVVSLTFTFNTTVNTAGYNLSAIRTFAGWDDGRDGQAYTVEYSTAASPAVFVALATVTRFDTPGDSVDYASTMVAMTPTSGYLAANVAALRFNFSGVENGGTAYREFDVFGTAATSAIPEPSTYAVACGALMLGFATWRRRRG